MIDLDNEIELYSLLGALTHNNCGSADLLSGKEEANCFNQRNYNAVKLSTEAKSTGLSKLFNKLINNDLDIDKEEEIYDY